ncbi:MAG: hypothetical protein ABI304_13505 [Rudaea sp.]
MHSVVSTCAFQKSRHHCLAVLAFFSAVTVAYANPVPQTNADVPYLGLYINLDHRFYAAGSDPNALSFESIEGDWAFVVYPAVMSSCASLGSPSLGDSNTFLVYGLSDPALPLASANYQTFADANGSVAVLSASSVPGDVACVGELSLVPVQYDDIYSDGFGGAL